MKHRLVRPGEQEHACHTVALSAGRERLGGNLVGEIMAGTPGILRADARLCLETMIGRGLHAEGEQILPCSTRRKERTIRIVSLWPLTELFHLCREVCTWCQTKSVKTRDAAKTRDRMALGSKCIVYLDNEYAVFSQIMGKCHAN